MKNDGKENLSAALIVAVVLSFCLSIATWVVKHPMFSEEPGPSDAEIHAMGDRLAACVEAWRSGNGRYPSDLEEANLSSPTSYRGGFTYKGDRTGFQLQIGVADGMNARHTYTSAGYGEAYPRKSVYPVGWTCAD